MSILEEKISLLYNYSACDVSDALLKLQPVPPNTPPRAGYIADLTPYYPPTQDPSSTTPPKLIAPASTLQFIPKSTPTPATSKAIPPSTHWSDLTTPSTILVISQPGDQHCAVVGGIMALRMKVRGVLGVVVDGRVRDRAELKASGLGIWARGGSTVGSGAEAKAGEMGGEVCVSGVVVKEGDIIFCDYEEGGVVAIPREMLDRVLEVMPKLVGMDDKVKEAVEGGMSVFEAFGRFRGKI
ncbi:DlpA domain protein [Aspergillus piperis CBS 112811]|uniref:DlpA domain protein n=1 Tax=Aspergillus piperis CBS 112811 TaxID=1448313 RepID=A0A8G1R0U8_9EURO|nr:DlpA domain protein [Aspergillus piperis CBS 112811]RAH57309.1 DlpA domain protein [Aspergillus piperis CBS 112811]